MQRAGSSSAPSRRGSPSRQPVCTRAPGHDSRSTPAAGAQPEGRRPGRRAGGPPGHRALDADGRVAQAVAQVAPASATESTSKGRRTSRGRRPARPPARGPSRRARSDAHPPSGRRRPARSPRRAASPTKRGSGPATRASAPSARSSARASGHWLTLPALAAARAARAAWPSQAPATWPMTTAPTWMVHSIAVASQSSRGSQAPSRTGPSPAGTGRRPPPRCAGPRPAGSAR